MENQGTHKRDKTTFIFWATIGFGLGIVIGASTKEWATSLICGTLLGIAMAWMATKPGLDQ